MALKKTNVEIPFIAGIDTKTADKRTKIDKLRELENGVFDRPGEINKRRGYAKDTSIITVRDPASERYNAIRKGRCLYARGNEIIQVAEQTREATNDVGRVDGFNVFSLDNGEGTAAWIRLGGKEPVSTAVETISRPTDLWSAPNMAHVNNYSCYAWASANNKVYISLIDTTTGATVIDAFEHDMGVHVESIHVVGFGTKFYVWAMETVGRILCSIVDVTNQVVGGMVIKVNNMRPDSVWDVCKTTHDTWGDCSLVVYVTDDATPVKQLNWYDDTATLKDDDTGVVAVQDGITVFEVYDHLTSTTRIIVAWQLNTGWIHGQTFETDGSSGGVYPIISRNVGVVRNMTGCRDWQLNVDWALARSYFCLLVEIEGTNGYPLNTYIAHGVCEVSGANAAEIVPQIRHCGLASKAFEYGGKARFWTVHDSTYGSGADIRPAKQNLFALRSFMYGEYLTAGTFTYTDAKALYTRAGGAHDNQTLSDICETDDNEFAFADMRKDVLLNLKEGNTLNSVVSILVKFDERALSTTMLGTTRQIGGGYVGDTDGRFQELGFHLYPEGLHFEETVAGTDPPLTVCYCAIYEWTDREGQLQRSAPSSILEAELLHGDSEVTVSVSTLIEGDPAKSAEIMVVLYRSTQAAPTIFHRLPAAVHKLNSRVLGYVDLVDAPYADTVIEEYEPLYTTGGVLPNICPPSTNIMNQRQNRLLVVDADDPTNIWYSKEKENAIAVEFSDLLTKRVEAGGDITALADMDDKEIVFKESQIRAFIGRGPNKLGADGAFTPDALVTTDAGCIEKKSVVRTDAGLLFKSAKGFYILTRGMAAEYIGAAVAAWNDDTVIDAELVKDENQVRFLLDTGECLVYEYLFNQWSVFTNHDNAVASTIWQGRYCYLKNTAVVMESDNSFSDGSDLIPANAYSLRGKTAWLNVAGMQGWQRIYWINILGTYKSPHTLTVKVRYNYDEAVIETKTFTADATKFTVGGPLKFRFKPKDQKCEAISLEIEDSNFVAPYESLTITSVVMTIGSKGRLRPLGVSKET